MIRNAVKKILPRALVRAISSYRLRRRIRLYSGRLSNKEVFTKIYKERTWGLPDDPSGEYYSGSGSHDPSVVETYTNAIGQFLRSFEKKPDVVDIGCGDFSVGSRVRPLCGVYTACDIVEPLIAFDKGKYKSLNVDFRVLDITKDSLPAADVIFLRQVLQHLSNAEIMAALPEIAKKYKYLVLSEHLPSSESFTPNLDIPTGPLYRVPINSGVVLTSPPFNLKTKEETVLCQFAEHGGIIKTILYKL